MVSFIFLNFPLFGHKIILKFLHSIGIRHSGYVVTDDLLHRCIRSFQGILEPLRKGFGMAHIIVKKLFYHMYRLVLFPFCLWIEIDILKHESAQICHRALHFRRHADLRPVHTVDNHVMHQAVQPRLAGVPKSVPDIRRDILFREYPRPDGIVHIVVDIGELVREPEHLSFQRMGCPAV